MLYENRWRDAWIIFAFFGENYFSGFRRKVGMIIRFPKGFNFIGTMGTLIMLRFIFYH